jgi:membrane protein implicated in regulation of membrane protease activity
MSILVALKKLVLGETWLLPVGLAAVVAGAGLLARPLAPHLWHRLGGFLILAGVLAVVLASVARAARSRS